MTTLAYWDIRGVSTVRVAVVVRAHFLNTCILFSSQLAQPIRFLLHYVEEKYEEKLFKINYQNFSELDSARFV